MILVLGPKLSIAVCRNNLIIVSPPFFPSAGSTSATVRHYVSKTSADGLAAEPSDVAKVTIFDLQNKLIAYSGTFRDGVRVVTFQWGRIFVFGANNKLTRLDEHSTAAKLELLYRRNLFTLAISLARSQGVGEAGVAEVHRRYGDYLYAKGDFDGAMGQFVKTLGYLQPSYVIRNVGLSYRYRSESHCISFSTLSGYTISLPISKNSTPAVSPIQITRPSCSTATPKHLIGPASTHSSRPRRSDPTSPVVVSTICHLTWKQPFESVARPASSSKRRTLPKNTDGMRSTCGFKSRMRRSTRTLYGICAPWGPQRCVFPTKVVELKGWRNQCQENMVLYGKTLLLHEPRATTELLIDLCSGNLGRKIAVPAGITEAPSDANGGSGPAVLSYLGYNRVQGLFSAEGQSSTPAATSVISTTAADTGKAESLANGNEIRSAGTEPTVGAPENDGPSYTPPSPRQFFAHFVDHHDLFVNFLESVALSLWEQKVDSAPEPRTTLLPSRDTESLPTDDPTTTDQKAVWNTLLELYLTSTRSADSAASSKARDKALGLLAMGPTIPYDPMHALILCSTSGFTDGLVGIWESMGMYEDVLRYHMEKDISSTKGMNGHTENARSASGEVLRYLDLYGPTNSHLYRLVLRYLTSSPEILSRHPNELQKLLQTIDAERIMPPLAVVQLLSRNGVASVGAVKEWLRYKVEETRQDVESDRSLVQSYRIETDVKQKELKDLANPRQPEVFQVTRCAACGGQLDLPSVHFMCKHSYHQR